MQEPHSWNTERAQLVQFHCQYGTEVTNRKGNLEIWVKNHLEKRRPIFNLQPGEVEFCKIYWPRPVPNPLLLVAEPEFDGSQFRKPNGSQQLFK